MKAQAGLIREVGDDFGMNYYVRIEKPIINHEIKHQLLEYFNTSLIVYNKHRDDIQVNLNFQMDVKGRIFHEQYDS